MEWLSRTRLLLGDEPLDKLSNAHVLIAGMGGVGAYAAEMIVRAGVGQLTIVDGDVVQPSNRNRQLPALVSTHDRPKTEVMGSRLMDINPDLKLNTVNAFCNGEDFETLLAQPFDYVVDAIDTLSPKVYLIYWALKHNRPLVSSMGAGGKIDPLAVKIDDVSRSYQCALARAVRKRLLKLEIKGGFHVVFSPEPVDKTRVQPLVNGQNQKSIVGTISYMPALFGLLAASHVIREIAK